MSGGGGGSGQTETRDTSSVKTSLTPIDVKASEMRTPASEEYRPQITTTQQGYYIPPSVIYANMFGQNPGYYVNANARSNYDPAKALALAEQQRVYQNKSAADLSKGYNESLYALAAQREATIAKQKAAEEAAKAAKTEPRRQVIFASPEWYAYESGYNGLNKNDVDYVTAPDPWGGAAAYAKGGLASLQGFKR